MGLNALAGIRWGVNSRGSLLGWTRNRDGGNFGPLPQAIGLEGWWRQATRDLGGAFFVWIAGNPLKSPESDKGIQENPSPFSWSGLVWLGFGLAAFGPGLPQTNVGRSRPAFSSERGKPVARDGGTSPSRLELSAQSLERIKSGPGNGGVPRTSTGYAPAFPSERAKPVAPRQIKEHRPALNP